MLEDADRKAKELAINELKHRLEQLGVRTVEREGVFVIIKNPRNRDEILLVRHGYGTKKWSLPGGGIKQGETAIKAALREVRDETGLAISVNANPIAHLSLEIKYGFTLLLEMRKIISGIVNHEGDGEEIIACRYFHKDELPEMYNAQRGMVGWALSYYGITQYGHPNKPPIQKYRTEKQ